MKSENHIKSAKRYTQNSPGKDETSETLSFSKRETIGDKIRPRTEEKAMCSTGGSKMSQAKGTQAKMYEDKDKEEQDIEHSQIILETSALLLFLPLYLQI